MLWNPLYWLWRVRWPRCEVPDNEYSGVPDCQKPVAACTRVFGANVKLLCTDHAERLNDIQKSLGVTLAGWGRRR